MNGEEDVGYYWAIKKIKILPTVRTQVDLEGTAQVNYVRWRKTNTK